LEELLEALADEVRDEAPDDEVRPHNTSSVRPLLIR
jgi:hypothetical protein